MRLLGALFFLGCSVPEFNYPPGPPKLIRFELQPLEVQPNGQATLFWQVEGADTVEIGGLGTAPAQGNWSVTATTTREFSLLAQGPGGTTRGRAQLLVRTSKQVRIERFEVEPGYLRPGELAELRWVTHDATRVRLRSNDNQWLELPQSGVRAVRGVENQSFELRAEGPGGTVSALAEVRVTQAGPQILRFYGPLTLAQGRTFRITWEVSQSDRVRLRHNDQLVLDQAVITSEGSYTSTLTAASIFVLEAEGPGGLTRSQMSVAMEPPFLPNLRLTATASVVGRGGQAVLTWQSDGDRVRLYQDGALLPGYFPLAGSHRQVISASTVFVMEADAGGPVATTSVAVQVDPLRPVIYELDATETVVRPDSHRIAWRTSEDYVTLNGPDGERLVYLDAQGNTPFLTPGRWLFSTGRTRTTTRELYLRTLVAPTAASLQTSVDAARIGQTLLLSWSGALGDNFEIRSAGRVVAVAAQGQLVWPIQGPVGVQTFSFIARSGPLAAEQTLRIEVLPQARGPNEVEPNAPLPLAQVVRAGETVEGLVEETDADVFRVEFPAGQRVRVTTRHPDGCDGLIIEVPEIGLEAQGCPELNGRQNLSVATLEPGFTLSLRATFGRGGSRYRLQVQAEPIVCGDGVIDRFEDCEPLLNSECSDSCFSTATDELEPNDIPARATFFEFGWVLRGHLPQDGIDWFRFEVPGLELFPLSLNLELGDPPCSRQGQIQLLDAFLRPLGRQTLDCVTSFGRWVVPPGTYYLGLSPVSHGGPYKLSVR